MPDATVVLSNPTLGTAVTLITTDDRVLADAAVVPSSGYALKVTRKGFTSWESSRFAVSAGPTVEFRIPLQAEEAETKGGGAGMLPVGTTKSDTAKLFTAAEVEALPASGRRLDELIPVAPAVTVAESQPGLMVTRGLPFSNTLSPTASTPLTVTFSRNPDRAEISQDAVEDFQVLAWRARSHSLNQSKEPSVLKPSTG